jgi:hypothetical protein
MIKVENQVEVYEKNGADLPGLRSDRPFLKVIGHWNCNNRIILKFEDNICTCSYTVLVKDLEAAIRNASNTARF